MFYLNWSLTLKINSCCVQFQLKFSKIGILYIGSPGRFGLFLASIDREKTKSEWSLILSRSNFNLLSITVNIVYMLQLECPKQQLTARSQTSTDQRGAQSSESLKIGQVEDSKTDPKLILPLISSCLFIFILTINIHPKYYTFSTILYLILTSPGSW